MVSLATTNHGGEGKWWPELTPYFKDRRVFLLCDNDERARSTSEVVGAALNGVATEVRVVRFPELPPKGDVSDFIKLRLDEGLDTEAIKELLYQRFREAPAWEPAPRRAPPRTRRQPPTQIGRSQFLCRRGYRRSHRLIRLCSRGLSRPGSSTSASGCSARLTISAPLH